MASSQFDTIELRRKEAENEKRQPLYYDIYQWKMSTAPPDLPRFCDPTYDRQRKDELVNWIR